MFNTMYCLFEFLWQVFSNLKMILVFFKPIGEKDYSSSANGRIIWKRMDGLDILSNYIREAEKNIARQVFIINLI